MGQNLRFTIVPLLRGERKNLMKNTSDKRENAWKSGVERVIDLLSSLFLPFINVYKGFYQVTYLVFFVYDLLGKSEG